MITVGNHFTARQLRRTTSTKKPIESGLVITNVHPRFSLTSSLTASELDHHLPSSLRASPSILTLDMHHPSSMPAILATHHRRATPTATELASPWTSPHINEDSSNCTHHPDWPTLSCTGYQSPKNAIYQHSIPWKRMPISEGQGVIEGYEIPSANKEYDQ
jgi:hypothetical protein